MSIANADVGLKCCPEMFIASFFVEDGGCQKAKKKKRKHSVLLHLIRTYLVFPVVLNFEAT